MKQLVAIIVFLFLFNTEGFPGSSLDYDGDADYIEMADNANLDFDATTDFAVAVWLSPDACGTDGPFVLNKGTAAGTFYQIRLRTTSCRILVSVDDGPDVVNSTDDGAALTNASWQHLVVNFDIDGNMTRYLNGVSTGTADALSTIGDLTNVNVLRVSLNTVSAWDGQMADLRIYRRLLRASEISELYAGNVIASPDNLALHLPSQDSASPANDISILQGGDGTWFNQTASSGNGPPIFYGLPL